MPHSNNPMSRALAAPLAAERLELGRVDACLDGATRHGGGLAAVLPLPVPPRPGPIADLVPANDLPALERVVRAVALRPGVCAERLGWVGGWPLHVLRVRASVAQPRLRVLVTAGVHGIEPAGPPAVLALIEQMLAAPERYADVELTAVPLVNPVGYHTGSRGNADRTDLNRSFRTGRRVPREVALVREVMHQDRYDLGIDVHSSRSSGERGYFVLHRDALDLLAPAMRRFAGRYPVLSEATDRYVVDAPGVLRSANRGTVKDYLADRGVRWAVTIEAPAVMPYDSQVAGSAELVDVLVDTARALRYQRLTLVAGE